MRIPALSLTLSAVLSAAMSTTVAAHEFNLLLLASAGAAQADIDDMRVAFLIASHETDSHPNETSEGHLGGLDVQLTLAAADTAVPDPAAAFVAAPFAASDDARITALAAAGDAVIVSADTLGGLPADLLQGGDGLGAFADRFRAETSREPGPAATGAYLAARAVDLAVRPLGSVDDRDRLRAALAP